MRFQLRAAVVGSMVLLLAGLTLWMLLREAGPTHDVPPGDLSADQGGEQRRSGIPLSAGEQDEGSGPSLRSSARDKRARWTLRVTAEGRPSLAKALLTLKLSDEASAGSVTIAPGREDNVAHVGLPWRGVKVAATMHEQSRIDIHFDDFPLGDYVVTPRLVVVDSRQPYLGLPSAVAVDEPRITTDLVVALNQPEGSILIEVLQDGKLVETGTARVYLEGEPILTVPLANQPKGGTSVPADKDLKVVLEDYPGASAMLEFPGEELRVQAGEVRAVVFAVGGIRTVLEIVSESNEAAVAGLLLWRHEQQSLRFVSVTDTFGGDLADRYVGYLPKGSYAGIASPRDSHASRWFEFDVEQPSSVQVFLKRGENLPRLTLNYSAQDGEPLADRRLVVVRSAKKAREQDWAHVVTDSAGRATTHPLRPGPYRVLDWSNMSFWEVELTRDDEIALTESQTSPTAYSLVGRLVTPKGVNASGVVIFVRLLESSHGRFLRPKASGEFFLKDLDEGVYQYDMPTPWDRYPATKPVSGKFPISEMGPRAELKLRIRKQETGRK